MARKVEKGEENEALRAMLYQALGEPIGLLVATDEPARLRQRLYQLRTLAEDPELNRLQIAESPLEGGSIVIVKVQRQEPESKKETLPTAAEKLLDL